MTIFNGRHVLLERTWMSLKRLPIVLLHYSLKNISSLQKELHQTVLRVHAKPFKIIKYNVNNAKTYWGFLPTWFSPWPTSGSRRTWPPSTPAPPRSSPSAPWSRPPSSRMASCGGWKQVCTSNRVGVQLVHLDSFALQGPPNFRL